MRSVNSQYDSLIRNDPGKMAKAIRGLDAKLLSNGCKFGNDPIPTFFKPYFLSESQTRELDQIASRVITMLEQVIQRYLHSREVKRHFHLSEKAEELVEIDPGYSRTVIIARPDSFLTSDGIRFVELNCDSPAGMGYSDMQERIFCRSSTMKMLEKDFEWIPSKRMEALLAALLDCYREYGRGPEYPHIAIVDWKEMRTLAEFYIMERFFESKGYEAVVADPRELRFRNGKLWWKGFRIDLVYRRVIFDELLARQREVQDFIRAYRAGKVCVVNPLRSKLAASKSLLSLLTDPYYNEWFSQESEDIRRRLIPWTRRVEDVNGQYGSQPKRSQDTILRGRKHFVIKPSDSYGGKNVHIGLETPPKLWRETVDKAFEEPRKWVVQERVDIPMMTVPILKNNTVRIVKKKMNLNPYILNGHYAGAIVRLSDESVINVSAGGGLIPAVTYKVRERDPSR